MAIAEKDGQKTSVLSRVACLTPNECNNNWFHSPYIYIILKVYVLGIFYQRFIVVWLLEME